MTMSGRLSSSFPGIYALHIGETVATFGIDPEALFAAVGLSRAALLAPAARVDVSQVIELCDRARRMTREPGLGAHLGLQMRMSAQTLLERTASTVDTFGDAIERAVVWAPSRTRSLNVALTVRGAAAGVVLEEAADFGSARDLIVVSLLVGLWHIGHALSGGALTGRVEVGFSEPAYAARLARVLPDTRFDRPAHQLIFDRALLDLPLPADGLTPRSTREQCERELLALRDETATAARVAGLIEAAEDGWPTLGQIARALCVSPRTLKRRLQREGTRFGALLDDERRQRAHDLLMQPELSVEHIALRLGYSDAANFTRAFRRMFGVSPRAHRLAQLTREEAPGWRPPGR